MNISLTKPLEEFVQTKVDGGMYASASEVVRAGLRILVEQELDTKIARGLKEADAGLGVDFNTKFGERIIKKVKNRTSSKQVR